MSCTVRMTWQGNFINFNMGGWSMRSLVFIVIFQLVSFVTFADEDVAPGYYLYRARVEAKACSLQIHLALQSIEKHLTVAPAETEICFDMGTLYAYLKELDVAVGLASDDLKNEPWETRYYFHLPFRERDNLMGACITSDPSMPVGDFKELRNRLLKMDEILKKLY